MTATDILGRLDVTTSDIADFCRRWHVKELAVFGSAARGDMRPDSDVDVMVEFEDGGRPRDWGLIDMQIDLAAILGRDVDLVTKGPIENPFRRAAILKDLTIVYAA